MCWVHRAHISSALCNVWKGFVSEPISSVKWDESYRSTSGEFIFFLKWGRIFVHCVSDVEVKETMNLISLDIKRWRRSFYGWQQQELNAWQHLSLLPKQGQWFLSDQLSRLWGSAEKSISNWKLYCHVKKRFWGSLHRKHASQCWKMWKCMRIRTYWKFLTTCCQFYFCGTVQQSYAI